MKCELRKRSAYLDVGRPDFGAINKDKKKENVSKNVKDKRKRIIT
jgi:hypothetical protein